MAIELAETFPCNSLKPLGDIPDIKLLAGAELKAFVDIAVGPPTDCKLTFNLLIQLAPLLASLTCLLKIFNVIMKLKEFAEAAKNPPDIPGAVPGLVGAITELEGCIPPLRLPDLALMLKGILQLVINFLSCFLTQLNSLFEFRLSLDFDGAQGNTVLTESLTCAKNGADAAEVNLLKALEPLVPIMSIAGSLGGIAEFPFEVPDFAAMSKSADVQASIQSVNDAIASLQQVVDSIPG